MLRDIYFVFKTTHIYVTGRKDAGFIYLSDLLSFICFGLSVVVDVPFVGR